MESNQWFEHDPCAIDAEVDKRLQEWETYQTRSVWQIFDKTEELKQTVVQEMNMQAIVDSLRDLQERVKELESRNAF